jgi:hypothetical protein
MTAAGYDIKPDRDRSGTKRPEQQTLLSLTASAPGAGRHPGGGGLSPIVLKNDFEGVAAQFGSKKPPARATLIRLAAPFDSINRLFQYYRPISAV